MAGDLNKGRTAHSQFKGRVGRLLLLHITRSLGVLQRLGFDEVYFPVLCGGTMGGTGLRAGWVRGRCVQGEVQVLQLWLRIWVSRWRWHGGHADHAQVVMRLQI